MNNKKVLIDALKNLNSAKAPAVKKDMIIDPLGQWAHPGENTRIPSNNITMDSVPYPVYADPNVGPSRMMYPEQQYNFPGADYVDEYPMIKKAGGTHHVVVKKSTIPGANKGLFSNQGFAKDQLIGLAHRDGQPVGDIGHMHNHSEEPNMYSVKHGNERYVYAKRNIEPGEELTTNYRLQPELEQPEDFMKKGGSAPSLPKKKNSKAYSRSLEATNRLFAEHPFFAKPKSRKNKIYDPNSKYYQEGGESGYTHLPPTYQAALRNFVYPNVEEDPERTGYNALNGTILYDSQSPIENMDNDWWREHELFHHLQNQAGGLSTYGTVGERPNPYVASDDSIHSYYDRRDSDVERTIDGMIAENPDLQFIPRDKLREGYYPGFIGAEDLQYADPSTEEGEARQYEQYIREGNPSIFPQKQKGGVNTTSLSPEEEQAFQKFYSTLPENLQSDDDTYDIRGYWDSEGRPEEFNYNQPKEDDGYYHAYSINGNTGEYLKSPAHDTFQHAINEDRKMGYRPITNVQGRNIAIENSSIAEPEEQSFLRNTEGPANYIEAELTPEEIEEYAKGGYIIEDISVPTLNQAQLGAVVKSAKNLGRIANIGTIGTANTLAKTLAPVMIPPMKILTMGAGYDGLGPFTGSPLNFVPFYGKDLSEYIPDTAFRKFGDTLDYVKLTGKLDPSAGPLLRMGKSQIKSEGNWAQPGVPNESYPGVFGARFDTTVPGSNLGYTSLPRRNGVLITDAQGNFQPSIPISDPGLSFHRRLPFSNRYIPINMEALRNDQFDPRTMGGNLQSLLERYGYAALGLQDRAAALGAAGLDPMGYNTPQEYLDEYVTDPVVNSYNQLRNYLQPIDDKAEELLINPWKRKKGGLVKAQKGLSVISKGIQGAESAANVANVVNSASNIAQAAQAINNINIPTTLPNVGQGVVFDPQSIVNSISNTPINRISLADAKLLANAKLNQADFTKYFKYPLTISGPSGNITLQQNTRDINDNLWHFAAFMHNPREAGLAFNYLNQFFPFPNPSLEETTSLSLDSFNLLSGMGKKPDWDMMHTGYIPLNSFSKHYPTNKLFEGLGNFGMLGYFDGSEDLSNQALDRLNKFISDRGLSEQAQKLQLGNNTYQFQLPNYKLTRRYQDGGLMKAQKGLSVIPKALTKITPGNMLRSTLYSGINPASYNILEKIKSFPSELQGSYVNNETRPFRVGLSLAYAPETLETYLSTKGGRSGISLAEFNKMPDVDKMALWDSQTLANLQDRGQRRLDAWAVGLGQPQEYGTLEQVGDNTYRMLNTNYTPEFFSERFNDLHSNSIAQSNLSEEEKRKQLIGLSERHYDLTPSDYASQSMFNFYRTAADAEGSPFPASFDEWKNLRRSQIDSFIGREPDNHQPWTQMRHVGLSTHNQDPKFKYSIWDNDTYGVMGGFRWDLAKSPEGLQWQSNDKWDLNPFERRGSAYLKPSAFINKHLHANYFKPLQNLEALSLVGGKPFNIQNNFLVDPTTFKTLKQWQNGGPTAEVGDADVQEEPTNPTPTSNLTEAQQWIADWYKNRKLVFPENDAKFQKDMMKMLPAYNPESPILINTTNFPQYIDDPSLGDLNPEGLNIGAAGIYQENKEGPVIRLNPTLNPTQRTDTEVHELTNYMMSPVRDKAYPIQSKIVEQNIIPFNEDWTDEQKSFYDYMTNPDEQNIQSYLNVARKNFGLKPDEEITPEKIQQMKKIAEEKGWTEHGGANFIPDIYLLFKMAKDEQGLSNLFNHIAQNNVNEDSMNYAQLGGAYELGDEVDEATMNKLKKQGYTFETIR